MLNEFASMLSVLERKVLEPVFKIRPELLGPESSAVIDEYGFKIGSFVSADRLRCPFQMYFSESDGYPVTCFYFGLGAEFAELEPIRSDEDVVETAVGIEKFLRSSVHVERERDSEGTVTKETYSLSLFVHDGRPMEFVAYGKRKGRCRLFGRTRERFVYQPWIE